MPPENRTTDERLAELERRLKAVENAENPPFVDSVKDRTFVKASAVDTSEEKETISITIGAGGGTDTADVFAFPDEWIHLERNGKIYKIPTYILKAND